MQIGETIATIIAMQDEGKCVFCDQKHDEPKKETIKETAPSDSGWRRKTMKGIFEETEIKKSIYPNGEFPPTYKYQGHHCIALSSLVENANSNPKDKILRLNHFLKKIDFYPNRKQNCIGLPARKSYGDFDSFWESIDLEAPLQMHGPGHDESYFDQVQRLLITLLSAITDKDFCQELSKSEWENMLKEGISGIENYAFNKLAKNESSWCLHRNEQATAIKLYKKPTNECCEIRGAYRKKITVYGKGHSSKKIIFPDINLDEGPFEGE